MRKILIGIIFIGISSSIFPQSKPGKYAHLSKYAGSWSIESIYNDEVIKSLMETDLKINIQKLDLEKESAFTQIDVIKGNMLISSNLKDDPCSSSTFMSISLTDDNTVYLVIMRDRKIKLFHTTFDQVTQNIKNQKLTKETNSALKKMISSCKLKKIQNI
jgi:hypothetical protein